jgi:hypothetical protein
MLPYEIECLGLTPNSIYPSGFYEVYDWVTMIDLYVRFYNSVSKPFQSGACFSCAKVIPPAGPGDKILLFVVEAMPVGDELVDCCF